MATTTVSLNQLLSAPVVTRVISTIRTPQSKLQEFLGFQPGGANRNPVGGHYHGWDIFDKTRTIATGRPPGTGPATIAPQIIGHVHATLYRAHEKIRLLDERIFRIRPLGRGYDSVDIAGQQYITSQEAHLAQRFRNSREFMVTRMLRGTFQLKQSGDDWIPVDSGGTFTVDYQIPAANKTQLNLTGAGNRIDVSWDNTGADVPKQLLNINADFEELHGFPLKHVWCNTTILNHLLNNDRLIELGGTSNVMFDQFARTTSPTEDNRPDTGFVVSFKGVPWCLFHVYDGGITVDGTYTKHLAATAAVFLPDPSPDWTEMVEGSELVRENVLSPPVERFGLAGWSEPITQPSGHELLAVDNALPALYLPKCVGYGTVVF